MIPSIKGDGINKITDKEKVARKKLRVEIE
jgi:hypothetical protein